MSRLDLVSRGYEALNQRDLDALRTLITPDFVLERAAGMGTVKDHDDVLDFTAPDAFEWQQFEPEGDVLERGDKLLVPVRVRARGAGSDVEVEQSAFHVATLRGGRIARLEIHFDRADALRALEEEPG